ncbi:DoxX family membrane protein [Streptomyces sp. SPB162]|uniref:DoxX family membrane protein n=1 Tax=Streptomyces sp. SPB162 TaxID=2940560 RepID=UPI002406B71E|nr:DoxX family membrane protein [Streptomyces sp. SPB162]MDF9814769.1 putative membrane protein YphA (DoxX/SURF4 family) [Streptomyces sp. SPB162]
MLKVPSDPAQVIVNHASFRVRLGATSARALSLDETARIPVIPSSVKRRAAPVVWSGRTEPGDPAAGRLLQAVRHAGAESGSGRSGPDTPAGSTQLLPRIDAAARTTPGVVGPRMPEPELLRGVRPARGAFDDNGYDGFDDEFGAGRGKGPTAGSDEQAGIRRGRNTEPVRHAWYPGHRMNLGVVLLPLRVFLGLISVYAGMSKLCDPVYFDGGERGSMVKWLTSLHPWAAAAPLRDLALTHPVGAGLTIAFLQVIVGVLTICGLWQRVAASVAAALSVALLVTVTWRTVPVYDAPDFIYLAAWSPLVIAGAPVYSVDGRLAGEAWRRLGPRADLWDLRKRVLRRGVVLATVFVGLTLVCGSVLGAAVRSSSTHTDAPAPERVPVNNLPGTPLPEVSGTATPGKPKPTPKPSKSAGAKKKPSKSPSASPTGTRRSGGTGSGSTGSGSSSSGKPRESSSRPTQSSTPHQTHRPTTAPTTSRGTVHDPIGGLLGSGSPAGLLLGRSGPSGDAGGTGGAA